MSTGVSLWAGLVKEHHAALKDVAKKLFVHWILGGLNRLDWTLRERNVPIYAKNITRNTRRAIRKRIRSKSGDMLVNSFCY